MTLQSVVSTQSLFFHGAGCFVQAVCWVSFCRKLFHCQLTFNADTINYSERETSEMVSFYYRSLCVCSSLLLYRIRLILKLLMLTRMLTYLRAVVVKYGLHSR